MTVGIYNISRWIKASIIFQRAPIFSDILKLILLFTTAGRSAQPYSINFGGGLTSSLFTMTRFFILCNFRIATLNLWLLYSRYWLELVECISEEQCLKYLSAKDSRVQSLCILLRPVRRYRFGNFFCILYFDFIQFQSWNLKDKERERERVGTRMREVLRQLAPFLHTSSQQF